jgi:hypothetical protein
VTTQEIEAMLADVDKQIITEIQLSHINGTDYSWRGRTRRWRLNSLKRALFDMLEYNKHEHHNINSFCRTPAKK